MNTTVVVAPREIHDLAYRASCVAGCDAGAAERIAHNVTFAEIHHGAAASALCEALEASDLPWSGWVTAPDALRAAEAEARHGGTASVAFEPRVPLAAIAGTLQQSLERGVAAVGIEAGARGDSAVGGIELHTIDAETTAACQAQIADARNDAYRHGIAVERTCFSKLEAVAAMYLIAEATLDEIDSRSSAS